jgi:CHAD domain-containing protein
VTATTSLRDYALEQVHRLMTRLVFQIHRTAKVRGPHAIHDARVSITQGG